jgi:hypothetical protein
MTNYDNYNDFRSLASISDWNILGVHWRLSNNFIKAMACFYESGYLVDAQGDVEGLCFIVSFIICMLTLFLMPLAGLHFCVGLDFVTPSL